MTDAEYNHALVLIRYFCLLRVAKIYAGNDINWREATPEGVRDLMAAGFIIRCRDGAGWLAEYHWTPLAEDYAKLVAL